MNISEYQFLQGFVFGWFCVFFFQEGQWQVYINGSKSPEVIRNFTARPSVVKFTQPRNFWMFPYVALDILKWHDLGREVNVVTRCAIRKLESQTVFCGSVEELYSFTAIILICLSYDNMYLFSITMLNAKCVLLKTMK